MAEIVDLVERLRAWARRYEPRSQERTLFLAAAERLEAQDLSIEAEVMKRQGRITVEAVEKAIAGRLLPWQKKALEDGGEDAA